MFGKQNRSKKVSTVKTIKSDLGFINLERNFKVSEAISDLGFINFEINLFAFILN
jgi:hypothetical protein